MTSTRSYRKALSQQTAFKELRENAGKQFHPRVVDALIVAKTAGLARDILLMSTDTPVFVCMSFSVSWMMSTTLSPAISTVFNPNLSSSSSVKRLKVCS